MKVAVTSDMDTGPPARLANVEARLCGMFAKVTGVASAGPDSNFFSLGGRGLKAMHLAALVRETYGVDLPLHSLLANATPSALAALIDTLPKAVYTRHGSFDIRMVRTADEAAASEGAILCMPQLGGGDDYANIVTATCLKNFDIWACRFFLGDDEEPYNDAWVQCTRDLAKWLRDSTGFRPIALLGFSAGGYTAWHVDRLLISAGRQSTKLINLDGGPVPSYFPDLEAKISSMLSPEARSVPSEMLLLHRERFGRMTNPLRFDHGWAQLGLEPCPIDIRTVSHLDVLTHEFLSAHDALISRFVLGLPRNEVMAARPSTLSTPGGKLFEFLDRARPPAAGELRTFIASLPPGRFDDDLELPLLWLSLASGDGDLACSTARRIVAERPDNRNAHYALVAALFELGRHEEAAAVADTWCNSTRLDPVIRARAQRRLNLVLDRTGSLGLFGPGAEMEHALDVAASAIG